MKLIKLGNHVINIDSITVISEGNDKEKYTVVKFMSERYDNICINAPLEKTMEIIQEQLGQEIQPAAYALIAAQNKALASQLGRHEEVLAITRKDRDQAFDSVQQLKDKITLLEAELAGKKAIV